MSRAEATRRVGASGRRMPRHLLPALALSLLLLCGACGPAFAENNGPARTIPLFAPGRKTRHERANGSFLPTNVSSFVSPFLAGGSGVMVALAEARFSEGGNDEFDAVFGLIDSEDRNWTHKVTKNDGYDWGIHWIHRARAGNHYAVRSPTAVIKGSKIYMFALTNEGPYDSIVSGHWYILMGVGEIMGLPARNIIQWRKSASLRSKLRREIKSQHLSVFPGSSNSAFLTSKGRILFTANATNEEGKWGFAIMQFKDDEERWEVSFVEKPEECSLFSLFEWKERLISVFSGWPRGTRHVMEYDEVKKEWKDAEGRLFHLLRTLSFGGLAPMTIGNMTALLFTGECHSHVFADGNCVIPLWLSDGIREFRAGWIYTSHVRAAFGRFVYTNDELYFLHYQNSEGKDTIVLTYLYYKLKTIKSVLKAWDENDAYLSRPCNETAPHGASPDTLCPARMPIDGLVGFLSDKGDATRWHDEYLFMNATVRGGTRVKNGYTFRDVGSGAWWPVGQILVNFCLTWSPGVVGKTSDSQWPVKHKKPDQRYNFTRYGMTVVATVTIHETAEVNTPLLTVDGSGVKERVGLWYKGNRWKVKSMQKTRGRAIELETNKPFNVMLVLQNNAISAYVNGTSLGLPLPISAPGEKPFDLLNIYIGGYKRDRVSNVTVTNVLLYNRPFNATEVRAVGGFVQPRSKATQADEATTPLDSAEVAATSAGLQDSF